MTLEAQEPVLDSRTHAELRDHALARIAQFAPGWTDFNESDPGKALVELFAWFTEQMIFAVNQTPRLNRLKFMQLIGMELRPAQPATAQLTFSAREGVAEAKVPIHTRIQADSESETPVVFETDQALDLIVPPLAHVQSYDGANFQVVTEYNLPGTREFAPFGWSAQTNSALYLGFTPPPNAPPDGAGQFPPEMRFRVSLPESAERVIVRDEQRSNLEVRLQWESQHPVTKRWRPLESISDETEAFTREGAIVVEGPRRIAATKLGKVADEECYWLRCRLLGGQYPPGKTPVLDFIRPNTVAASSLETIQNEVVGISNGRPGQVFQLRRRPVLLKGGDPRTEALPRLVVLGRDEQDAPCERVGDLLAVGDGTLAYTFQATTGRITFGDGRHGQIPEAGATIIARVYRYGGGAAANVDAGKIADLLDALSGVDAVVNERPSVGGADEQSVDELVLQAAGALRRRDRAVTADDAEAIAREVGGVARARALAGWHPGYRDGVVAPGTLTVVVVADSAAAPPNPSRDLLAAVWRYLDERRLVGTELFVTGPKWRMVRIELRVAINPLAASNLVREEIRQALRTSEELDPLKQRFGGPFYPTSLYNEVLDVKSRDVIAVRTFRLYVDGAEHKSLTEPVALARDELLFLDLDESEIVTERADER